MEYLLYGLEKGENREYMESLLLVTDNAEKLEKIKVIASDKGYTNLRVATYNGEKPDFTKILARG